MPVFIDRAVDVKTGTLRVRAAFLNPERLLRPGGFVKASVVTQTTDEATVVPVEAIVRFAGVTKLFVVRGEKAYSVPVETGMEGSGWVVVEGDVAADASVVVSGQTQLADGAAVVIRQTTDKPAAEAARAATADREMK